MECWPLGIVDKGKKGTLEDADRIVVRSEVPGDKGETKCSAKQFKPRDYFSAGSGGETPMDRLKALVDGEPQVRTVNPALLQYIFDQQREWYRNQAGH